MSVYTPREFNRIPLRILSSVPVLIIVYVQGIYPTVVIIIVHNGVSALDSVIISRNAPVSSLQFASNTWSGRGPTALKQDSDDPEDEINGHHHIQEREGQEPVEGKDLV